MELPSGVRLCELDAALLVRFLSGFLSGFLSRFLEPVGDSTFGEVVGSEFYFDAITR